MAFRPTNYAYTEQYYPTAEERLAEQRKSQNAFTTDIMNGVHGDVWGETLTKWGRGEDTSGFKAKMMSELSLDELMKQDIIEKTSFHMYFRWPYEEDTRIIEDILNSFKYKLKNTFDAIMQLLEVGVEDTPTAWNYLKRYSLESEWDTKRAKNEDVDIRRAIVKKTAAKFVDSAYYKQKLNAWVSIGGNRENKKVKKRIVDELKDDMPTSIDIILYAIKQTDMQKDHNYTDMSTDDSDFDHMLVYIFNSIATVLAAGATNTRSAWDKLKENENEKKYVIALFNVKAAVKSIVRPEPAPVYSDPMDDPMDIKDDPPEPAAFKYIPVVYSDPTDEEIDIDHQSTQVAALLRLLQSHISS